MRKNRMMRAASALLVAVLMTTCTISGTFAKYTTSVTSQDSARVAYWGFQPETMDIEDLFLSSYDNVQAKNNGDDTFDDVIAPGATGKDTFIFAYNEANATAPEVDYTFTVDVVASCDDAIKNNANIQWKLDSGAWGTWDQMIAAIKALSGDASGTQTYTAGNLPAAFGTTDTEHTISWQWVFYTDADADVKDTGMGNAADLADCSIKITITATQIGD